MRTRILAALVGFTLAGCTVGPDYTRPVVDTPAAWRIDYPKAAEVANTKWWEQFGDPVLNELIESALRENRDVRIAAARVDQFIGALDVDAIAALSPARLRRRREPHPLESRGRAADPAGRRSISPCIRRRWARPGSSISSAACAA